jgi:2-keto-4-pentenoate hydratase
VLAAVAAIILDRDSRYRYDLFRQVGAAQLIADNCCADQFVLGATSVDWRSLDLSALATSAASRVKNAPAVVPRCWETRAWP